MFKLPLTQLTKLSVCKSISILVTIFVAGSSLVSCVPASNNADSDNRESFKASSTYDCVEGVTSNNISGNKSFTDCVAKTKEPLDRYERSRINSYLLTLNNDELEMLSTNILDKSSSVDLNNRQEVISSILDQVESVNQSQVSRSRGGSNKGNGNGGHDHGSHQH